MAIWGGLVGRCRAFCCLFSRRLASYGEISPLRLRCGGLGRPYLDIPNRRWLCFIQIGVSASSGIRGPNLLLPGAFLFYVCLLPSHIGRLEVTENGTTVNP